MKVKNNQTEKSKKVNHRPQLEKVKNEKSKKNIKKTKKVEKKQVNKKSKLWLLALADNWSQETSKKKSTVDHSSKKSKKSQKSRKQVKSLYFE